MPQPPTFQQILHLLTLQYHDGRYLNGHPEICEWLDSNPDKTYFIQQMEDELGVKGYNNVRIWSSQSAYEESLKKREERAREIVIEEPEPENITTLHPIVLELYNACEKRDLDSVYMLKKKCRALNLKFDKTKTDMRGML